MLNDRQLKFLEVLEDNLGVTDIALQKTGVTREEFREWKENVFFDIKLKDIEEKSLDYVEQQLLLQIQEGNTSAITFYLKTKGKYCEGNKCDYWVEYNELGELISKGKYKIIKVKEKKIFNYLEYINEWHDERLSIKKGIWLEAKNGVLIEVKY